MGLSLSLEISHALMFRQEIETRLYQALAIVQKLRLELELYRKREQEVTNLYQRALARRMVKLYKKHGMTFEYALVPARDVPKGLKDLGMGFSHCLFDGFDALIGGRQYALAKGSWLLFVVHDFFPNAPQEFVEYVAVHERGEQVTLGDHNLASKLEFAIARKESRLRKYMDWLEKYYPEKFADVFSYQVHLDLPASDEFQNLLEQQADTGEAKDVREAIESFEWPLETLRKLKLYVEKNEEVITLITRFSDEAKIVARESALPIKEIVVGINNVVRKCLETIEKNDLRRYISFPRMSPLWKEQLIDIDNVFVKTLTGKQSVDPVTYRKQLLEVGIGQGLPKSGALSPSFPEAIGSL